MTMTIKQKLIASTAIWMPLLTGACSDSSLRIATHAQLESLDPIRTTAYITRSHGYMVYDTLFALDQNLDPKPQMVESYATSPDGRTWTFALRPGLKWSDGSDVTAPDCVASLQRWAQYDGTGQELFKNISSLRAPDNRTIVMQLSQPNALVLQSLAKMSATVPFMMPKRVVDAAASGAIADPTGSGPYIFQKDKWTSNRAVYVRNPYYVPRNDEPSMAAGAKRAKEKEIDFVYFADQRDAVAALVKGDVSYVESPSTKYMAELTGKPNVVVASTDPLGNVAMMRFNSNAAPFDNAAVRRAVLMTIDQRAYMEAALGDKRFYRLCHSVYPCTTASDAESPVLKTANLEAARQALAAAHYDGTPVVILNPKDNPVISALTDVTAKNLKEIGMTVDVRNMTWAEMLKERTKPGAWSLFHTWWLAGDVANPLSIAFSGSSTKGWPGAPDDAQLESYRTAYSQTTDPEAKRQLAAKVQQRVLAIAALGTLGQFYEPVAFRDNLKGITSPIQFYWTLARDSNDTAGRKRPLQGSYQSLQGQFYDENVGY